MQTPPPQDTTPRQEFLTESIRLAELKLQEFTNGIRVVENKAMLLSSVGVVLVSYLSDTDTLKNCQHLPHGFHEFHRFLHILSFVLITIATFIGAKAIDLARIGLPGLSPIVSQDLSAVYQNANASIGRSEHLLRIYQTAIKETWQTAERKTDTLKTAKELLTVGATTTTLWMAANILC